MAVQPGYQNAPGLPEGMPMPFPGVPNQKFFYCSDIDLPVKLKVLSLDGQASFRDYYVTAQLWADDRKIGPAVNTGFGKMATIQQYNWNSVLNFSVKYSSLPVTTQLAFTIWDISKPEQHIPFGGATISLFSKRFILRKGRQKLHVWEGSEGDGSSRTKTPGKLYRSNPLDEIEKLIKKWSQGRLNRVEWLDKLASRAIEKINLETDQDTQDRLMLFIEMPEFEHPVVFFPKAAPQPTARALQLRDRGPNRAAGAGATYSRNGPPTLHAYEYDPDVLMASAAERKHRTLTRARKRSPLDAAQRSLKPNSSDRQLLNRIVAYPLTKQLTELEMEKLWNFRCYLRTNKKALTKFVRCIEWTQQWQADEAMALMNQWETIDIEDALELLSSTFARFPGVRAFAVNRLESATDEDVCLFLMQFVQALRYDKLASPTNAADASGSISELASFLIERATHDDVIGTYLYWYLKVETLAPAGSSTHQDVDFYHRILKEFIAKLEHLPHKADLLASYTQQETIVDTCAKICSGLKVSKLPRQKKIEKLRETLKEGGENATLLKFTPMPLPLDPRNLFEGVHPDAGIFNSAMNPIRLNLKMVPERPLSIMFKMGDDMRQDQLVVQLISLMDSLLKKENLDLKLTPYKVLATSRQLGMVELVPNSTNIADVLKKYEGDLLKYLKHYNPAPAKISAATPAPAASASPTPGNPSATPPSSATPGASTTSGKLAGAGMGFNSDTELDTYGVAPEALDNFVRSCAGYCVITYLLGIGDRHLDNLLITHDGKLFHIDFGFIMGRDPKPLPPPMKLCKEMVFGMGGHDSPHYDQFKSFACEAYNILRKSGNLILSLCSLMVDSNLEDIDGMRSILKLQEKFKLDVSDEDASAHLQNLITESVRAIVPSLMEKVHQWAKYWRN